MEGGKSMWINVICLSRLCLSVDVSENKFCDQFMQKCVLNLFPVTVLYKRLLQHTQKHCGKQMHEASGNHFRHLTWYFTIVFFMFFKCQNSALRFAPAWTCVYISGTTHVREDFSRLCVCKSGSQVCLALCRRQWANFLSIGVLLCVGASINVTVRNITEAISQNVRHKLMGEGQQRQRNERERTEHGKA